MNKSLLLKIKNYLKKPKNISRGHKVFALLAILVFLCTIYALMMPAITMEEVLICSVEDHEHTEECYGTDQDQEKITYLLSLIEDLPTLEEMNDHIEELSTQGSSSEEIEKYQDEMIASASNAYSYYTNMESKLQKEITNIDKLLEYKEANLIVEVNNTLSVALLDEYEPYAVDTIAETDYNLTSLTAEDGVANTKEFIKVNLFDYGTSINEPYVSNPKYPGFQQDGGSKSIWGSSVDGFGLDNQFNYGFGNNITTDIAEIRNDITKDGTGINVIPDINSSLTGTMQSTLKDGYPALSDGTSLGYLFGAELNGTTYAQKQNKNNIDGLFLYDSNTGAYSYDSRKNHAQFNSSNDTFSLYNEIITSNFMMFPFGNFLPFNNINTQTTKASDMGSDDFKRIVSSAVTKYKNGNGEVYNTLSNVLTDFDDLMIERYDADWNAGEATTSYFKAAGLNQEITTEDLENRKVYSIDYDEATNFFFGLEMKMNFMQPKSGKTGLDGNQDMKFYFTGDDDVWVYVDGILFLDLSGIHRHVGGEIDFVNGVVNYYNLDVSTGDVSTKASKTVTFAEILGSTNGLNEAGTFEDYSTHTFNFYYMERGAGSGVMRMNFNFPLLKQNSISVTKELSVDEGTLDSLGNPDFDFQILSVDEAGNKTDDSYIAEGTKYEIYEHYDTNRELVDTGVVGANGIFSLKAGQTAVFSNIDENSGQYYVREIIDADLVLQYGKVSVDGKDITIDEETKENIASGEFAGFESNIKDISEGSTIFTFNNNIVTNKYGSLKISKVLEGDNTLEKQFRFEVTLDGEKLPVGTKYTITTEDGTIQDLEVTDEEENDEDGAGIIFVRPTETATIGKILAGTYYEVVEINSVVNDYTVEYQCNGEKVDQIRGVIMPKTAIEIIVKNIAEEANLRIPITKMIANSDSSGKTYSYQFKLTEVKNSNGEALEGNSFSQEITIEVMDEKDGEFLLEYKRPNYSNGETVHYYKIEEMIQEDTITKYDDHYYIIKLVVTKNNENGSFDVKVTNVYDQDGKDITNLNEKNEVVNEFTFTNHLLTELMISKEVVHNEDISGSFEFELQVTYDLEEPISGIYDCKRETNEVVTFADQGIQTLNDEEENTSLEECSVTFVEGKSKISLSHKESITIYGLPYQANYLLTELTTNGYVVEYSVNSGDIQIGTSATADLNMGNNQIKFINVAGYELPTTGGSGILTLVIIGLLLFVVPIIYIGYSFYKKKEV